MRFRISPLLRPALSALFLCSLPLHAQEKLPAWIWSKAGASDGEELYLRKTFAVQGKEKVRLSATCDNEMIVFVNGKRVADGKEWSEPASVDITPALMKGDNLIAVKAINRGNGAAGFIAKIFIEREGKKEEIVTDTTWKVSPKGGKDWNTSATLDETNWKPAFAVGFAGEGPWAKQINAKTLDNVTEAKAPEATPVGAIKVKEGFKVELLHSVNMASQGSWVVSTFDGKGRLIVSDQYGGLFRVTVPPLGGKPEETKVEPIPVALGEAQGLCWAFDSLYVVTNSGKYPRGLYRVTDTNKDDMLDKVEQLRLFANSGGEHGPHAVLPGPDGKSLYVVVGNQTPVTETSTSRVPKHWAEDNLLQPPLVGRGFMREVMAPAAGWRRRTRTARNGSW